MFLIKLIAIFLFIIFVVGVLVIAFFAQSFMKMKKQFDHLRQQAPKQEDFQTNNQPTNRKIFEDDEGEYAGVGILISSNYLTGICTISRVFKGSPAEAAGVQRGDILYRVGEDLYVVPETLQDAVDIMRGTPGTTVDVTFLRNGEEITFTLERAIINVNQIESVMLTENIGLIALYEFSGKCDEEFEAALDNLTAHGAQGQP